MWNFLGNFESLCDLDSAWLEWTREAEAFEAFAQVIFLIHDLGASKMDLDPHCCALFDRFYDVSFC